MTPRHLSDDEMNALLNSIKPSVPAGAVVALFVFQEKSRGSIVTDYVSNTNTRSLAHVLRDWARGVINGSLTARVHPRGGVTH